MAVRRDVPLQARNQRSGPRFGATNAPDEAICHVYLTGYTPGVVGSKMGSAMSTGVETPFGPSVQRVPLARAPLALVVAQVRYPLLTGIDAGGAFLAPFQEALRDSYPVLRREREVVLALGGAPGLPGHEERWAWQFESQTSQWRVRLSSEAASLSTTEYTNRPDFIARLSTLIDVTRAHLRPGLCDRLGVRFVSRITAPEQIGRLSELIEPAPLGAMSVVLGVADARLQHSLADMATEHDDGSLLRARWGILPPNGTFDVSITPSGDRSFLLDIDIFTTRGREFSPSGLMEAARAFCDRQYRFFRWLVTDQFLREFGGDV